MSEELNDFTPSPKVEAQEELHCRLENHELLLDDYINIYPEKPKEFVIITIKYIVIFI